MQIPIVTRRNMCYNTLKYLKGGAASEKILYTDYLLLHALCSIDPPAFFEK